MYGAPADAEFKQLCCMPVVRKATPEKVRTPLWREKGSVY